MFDKPFGMYFITINNHVFINCGNLLFLKSIDEILLKLGIHPNFNLQTLYQKYKIVNFDVFDIFSTLEEALIYKQNFLSCFGNKDILNHITDITNPEYYQSLLNNKFVDSLYEKYSYLSDRIDTNTIVYIFHNDETSYFYIGSGTFNRKNRHTSMLKNNNHTNYKFQNCYNKNQNFDFYYAYMLTRKDGLSLEQNLLDLLYGNKYIINLAKYVELGTLGLQQSEETIDKKRNALLLFYSDPQNKELCKHSDETRRILKQKHIDRWSNPELRKKYIEIANNRNYTDDTLKAYSNRLKERWENSEYKDKMRNICKRRWNSLTTEQQKEKMKNMQSKNMRKVSIDGEIFSCIGEASILLCIKKRTIEHRLDSKNWETWFKV